MEESRVPGGCAGHIWSHRHVQTRGKVASLHQQPERGASAMASRRGGAILRMAPPCCLVFCITVQSRRCEYMAKRGCRYSDHSPSRTPTTEVRYTCNVKGTPLHDSLLTFTSCAGLLPTRHMAKTHQYTCMTVAPALAALAAGPPCTLPYAPTVPVPLPVNHRKNTLMAHGNMEYNTKCQKPHARAGAPLSMHHLSSAWQRTEQPAFLYCNEEPSVPYTPAPYAIPR